MNCSSSVYSELSGWRAWEAVSDLHRYHTPFVSDWEADFLECPGAWLWWCCCARPPPGPSCLMMYAAQPSSGCIV